MLPSRRLERTRPWSGGFYRRYRVRAQACSPDPESILHSSESSSRPRSDPTCLWDLGQVTSHLWSLSPSSIKRSQQVCGISWSLSVLTLYDATRNNHVSSQTDEVFLNKDFLNNSTLLFKQQTVFCFNSTVQHRFKCLHTSLPLMAKNRKPTFVYISPQRGSPEPCSKHACSGSVPS